MNRDKVLELAREVFSSPPITHIGTERLCRFAALIEAEVSGGAEPVAFEFQHEDTGLIDFVDPQQVEWGFQKNNPRWQLIAPVFRHPAPAVVSQLIAAVEQLRQKARWINDEQAIVGYDEMMEMKAALAAAKVEGL